MPFPFVPKNSIATSVAVTTGPAVQLLASRIERLGFSVFNSCSGNMYLKLGSGASSSSFTSMLVPNAYFESPFFHADVVTAVLATGSGNAQVEEWY